jgi:Mce-associated membrane protein
MLLAVTVLGLACVVAGSYWSDRYRNEIVSRAEHFAIDLTTLHSDRPEAMVDSIRSEATPNFAFKFGTDQPWFADALRRGIDLTGTVTSAGLIEKHGDSAKVLVAVNAVVTTPGMTQRMARNYQLRISMQDVDGSWLADDVEFLT